MRNYHRQSDAPIINTQSKEDEAKQTFPKTILNRSAKNNTTTESAHAKISSRFRLGAIPKNLTSLSPSIMRHSLMQLQRDYGNQHVQRVLEVGKKAEGEADVTPDVEQTIDRARGGGQALDTKAGSEIGGVLNADFSGVRVHTGTEANSLNHSLNAKAFTTGQDIFFRQGEYNPGSSSGKALLAHELTHVVQQNPKTVERQKEDNTALLHSSGGMGISRSIQTKLTVGSPGDVYEQEADQMAQNYTAWEQTGSNPSAATGSLNRQAVEEEEKEPMAMSKQADNGLLSRVAEEPDEEMAQTKPQSGAVQRQGEMEEEEAQ